MVVVVSGTVAGGGTGWPVSVTRTSEPNPSVSSTCGRSISGVWSGPAIGDGAPGMLVGGGAAVVVVSSGVVVLVVVVVVVVVAVLTRSPSWRLTTTAAVARTTTTA